MGDPRRIKNKYSTPGHPWEKTRLDAEKPLMKEYGLVNKKELWKISSKLKNFKDNAKKLVASKSGQAIFEKKQMVERMKSYGLINSDALDEILSLEIQQLLDRRLQTIVYKKGLAKTVKQARQMITHRHIAVKGIKITAPSYLVKVSEQESIMFMPSSNFANDDHPERIVKKEESKKEESKKEESEKPKKTEKKESKKEESEKEVSEKPKKTEKKESKKEESEKEVSEKPKKTEKKEFKKEESEKEVSEKSKKTEKKESKKEEIKKEEVKTEKTEVPKSETITEKESIVEVEDVQDSIEKGEI